MSEETVCVMVEKILQDGRAHNIFIWQGGEPTLMGLDFFREVARFQQAVKRDGQVVENCLQTNGLLLDDEWCEFLTEEDWLVGISLDGPEKIHDHYRITPDGKGTFARVMDAIERMRRKRVKFNILALLTDANVREPESVYRFFRKNNFNFLQFINCFEWDEEHARLTGYSVSGREVGKFYEKLFDLWMDDGFPHVSIRFFEDILIYHIDGRHVSCCWMESCDNYFVVEHNGDCYPCDFFVYPDWRIGNIVTDELDAILYSQQREKFAGMKSEYPAGCSDCSLFQFCHGDCTKFRQTPSDGFAAVSEYCGSLKSLISHMEPRLGEIHQKVMDIRSGRAPLTAGRNDPCPCGSGKKYKHCCGKG